MTESMIAPLVLDGWFVLHQFLRMTPGMEAELDGRREALEALRSVLSDWDDLGTEGWTGVYRIVGGGADLMLAHFRPSLEALAEVERRVDMLSAGSGLILTGDYLSVVELSMYHLTDTLVAEAAEKGIEVGSRDWSAFVDERLSEELEKRYVQERLHPTQPEELPYVCFYPMDKRRNEGQNWYRVPLAERAAMMRDHGTTGRRYAGRISQVICGSMGLDDWEWAVTLFGRSPNDFKELIAEMRYDEVSAVYAEFGSFWVGYRMTAERMVEELAGP
jgi:peroxiredoxin